MGRVELKGVQVSESGHNLEEPPLGLECIQMLSGTES